MPLPKSFTKVTTFSKWLALSLFIILPIAAFYYGTYYQKQITLQPQADELLLSITQRGGLCPNGECTKTTVIQKNGNVVKEGKLEKTLTQEEMTQLQNLIMSTDFTQLKNTPFTGTCPTAYDGTESTFTFYTANKDEPLASCTYRLEGPLFQFVETIINEQNTHRYAESEYKDACEEKEGTWLDQYKECESMQSDKGLNQESCTELGGKFNGCNSACRHNNPQGICAAVCVKTCMFQ